jgi:hypothetical protein
VTERDAKDPFLTLPTGGLVIQQVDAVRQVAHLASVELDGLDVRAIRRPDGAIDLLALARADRSIPPSSGSAAGGAPAAVPPAAAAPSVPPSSAAVGGPASTSPSSAASGGWSLRLDRFDLRQGTATFEDRFVRPETTLSGTDLAFTIEGVTWPVAGPTTWKGSLTMPGGGRTDIEGDGLLDPVNVRIKLSTRDAPLDPYDAYFPFPARLRGLLSGDSANEIEQSGGVWRAASRGTAWGSELEVWGPGRDVPDIRVDGMEIRGIDFSWPNYAFVEGATFKRPNVQIERDRDGAFNLRRLFEVSADGAAHEQDPTRDPSAPTVAAAVPPASATPAPVAPAPGRTTSAAPPAAAPSPAPAPVSEDTSQSGADEDGDPLRTLVLDFKELAIEGGYIRFLDRTTTPTFSQEMSRLELRIGDLTNVLGRQRTTLTVTALVGGDAGLDLRGELSGIGESLNADLVGELQDYPLATANPYADRAISWVVERGKLATKFHYRVEGDVVTAEHDVKIGGLQVRRSGESDTVKDRVGLPLGLVVGLLKDTRGDIDFNLPLKASVKDRAVDWTETVWAGVKQVILKVVVGPFRAIGRAFRGGGDDTPDRDETPDLSVDPVTFAAGSSVIAPDMEAHLTKVADFLRRSPNVGMTLRPVVTQADVESLKTQALTARIQAVQEERKLKEFAAAVAVYYKAQKLPADAAKTPDEQLAALQKQEPVPEPRVQELLERRVAAAREALVKTEGIMAERLTAKEPAEEPASSGQGRVEFAIGGGE